MRFISRYGPLWHRNSLYRSPTNSNFLIKNWGHHNGKHAPLSSISLHQRVAYSSRTLIFPEAPSDEHHDLASYAAYAARTGLDVTSKTFIGTRYEYAVAAALSRLGFTVKRVGGRADCGIDLLGVWHVPPPSSSATSSTTSPPLRVLFQCKASASPTSTTRIGPHLIRELEGAFAGAPAGWRRTQGQGGVLGLLVTQRPATKGVRDALARSRWPMGYVSCSHDGKLEQLLWNERAGLEGLDGMGAAVQYTDDVAEKQLVLTWQGKPIVFD